MRDTSVPEFRSLSAGEVLHRAGETGGAWVLLEGSIRLDRSGISDESGFAGLAIKGDILGAETLLLDGYTYNATALTVCKLTPWPGETTQLAPAALLQAIARIERRGADAVALRCGEAAGRVRRLVELISGATPVNKLSRLMLPALRDMADITALTIGTVSRTLVQLQAEGMLVRAETQRGRPRIESSGRQGRRARPML